MLEVVSASHQLHCG